MTTRTDRMNAARRAAAPSVDFSLLPRSPAMDALLALANAPRAEAAEATEPTPEPPAPREASPVAGRFSYRARPRGDRTLQPMEAPRAHALHAPLDQADAAATFVAAHLGEAPAPAAPRQSEIPTLILDVNRRRASPTLEPLEPSTNEQLDDDAPTFPPGRSLGRRSQRLDTDLLAWISDEPTTLSGAIPIDEEVDPELDAWMRSQGRRRIVALTGAVSAMIALCAAAMAGLIVVASPIFDAPAAVAPAATVAPPPAPAPVLRTLVVERGDTFARLLAGHPVDALAVHAAALPLHDLSRLEVGDTVVLELDPAGTAVREVRYDVDGGRTLVVRSGADGWTASLR